MLRLGGPEPHGRRSGVVHILTESEAGGARPRAHRRLPARLPGQPQGRRRRGPRPRRRCCRSPRSAPTTCTRSSSRCSTRARPRSCTQRWAPNIVTALGRFGGRTVGVVANNPLRLGGCLDSLSAEKASRFVRMCDAFGVPLIVLVDVPGYLPGVGQEWDGVVRRGAKLLHAFGECVVPRVTLVTRKTYGGAYIAMNSRALGATKVFAWPGAEVAVMGAVAAIRILHRRRLADVSPDLRPQVEAELAAEHERLAGGVDKAVEIGVVDEVVEPTHPQRHRAGHRPRGPAGRRRSGARQHPAVARWPTRAPDRGAGRERRRHRIATGCVTRLEPVPLGRPRRRGAASAPARPRRRAGRSRARRPTACRAACRSRCSERRVAERGLDHRGLEPVLGDHDVAVQAGDGVEDAEVGGVGVARALGLGGRVLGDLEAQVVPAAQRGGDRPRRCRAHRRTTARRGRCRPGRAAGSTRG